MIALIFRTKVLILFREKIISATVYPELEIMTVGLHKRIKFDEQP